jgi:hypothetical protein
MLEPKKHVLFQALPNRLLKSSQVCFNLPMNSYSITMGEEKT